MEPLASKVLTCVLNIPSHEVRELLGDSRHPFLWRFKTVRGRILFNWAHWTVHVEQVTSYSDSVCSADQTWRLTWIGLPENAGGCFALIGCLASGRDKVRWGKTVTLRALRSIVSAKISCLRFVPSFFYRLFGKPYPGNPEFSREHNLLSGSLWERATHSPIGQTQNIRITWCIWYRRAKSVTVLPIVYGKYIG